MSKSNGFLQLRRGLWEHVRDGRMTVTEALAFIYICCEADTRTGIWKGSAKSLSGELGIPERTARDVLEKMEHGAYIRRFAVPGRHVCYPILVHKFPISQGEHNGEQLNAIASTSPADLAYFPREQSVEQHGEHGVEHGAAQKRSKKEKEKREKVVRRTQNAELRVVSSSCKKNPKKEKKERLAAHLAGKIARDGERIQDWDLSNWEEEIREAFDFIGYELDRRNPQLSAAFLITACEVYQENRNREISLGNLCSKIIDRCVRENKQDPDGGYYWPTDFQEYRDRLRQVERASERSQATAMGA